MYCIYINGDLYSKNNKTELSLLELNQILLHYDLSLGIDNLNKIKRCEIYTLDKKRINIIKQ